MGIHPVKRTRVVDADFETYYWMLIYENDRHRAAIRYEIFDIDDKDDFTEIDDSTEDGDALTVAYRLQTGERHSVGLEYIRVDSSDNHRLMLDKPADATEDLVQVSFRVIF
ncbi:MAG: hypothetical protein AAF492_23235, partial [Verrucomicrobiota bacterium]